MRQLTMACSAALLLACAGGGGTAVPDGWREELLAERSALDRRTREGETTPFTPIDVRMVGAGERISVALCDGVPRFGPPPQCSPAITLEYDAGDGFRVVDRDGSAAPAENVVPLGSVRLALSRQEDRGRVLVHDPAAPAQREFRGYRWYEPDPAWRFVVRIEPFDERRPVRLGTTVGLFKTFERYGRVTFDTAGGERSLTVYLPPGGDPANPEDFFVPFRDATSGGETYAVGRYVALAAGEAGETVLDLNRATNPNCAYNDHWNCPIPPPENFLDVAVQAGEKPYRETSTGH